ncbi:class I SAM-dependent methyltransferase [Dermacoccus abyssi]
MPRRRRTRYVTGELEELFTTRRPDSEPSVLDAGAGHGAEALWLAAHGWNVTAVDFSPAALDFGQRNAAQAGADVAERITWVEGDLGVWAPEPRAHDVVLCLYVHCAGDMAEMITRLASGVAPGGRSSWSATRASIRPRANQPVPQGSTR